MDILKDKIIMLSTFIYLFMGCSNVNTQDITNICGFKVSDVIVIDEKTEQWDSWQGDGSKVIVYSIINTDYFVKNITNTNLFKKFDDNDSMDIHYKSLSNPSDFLSKYLRNGKGYYRYIEKDNEIREVIIDLKNKKLVYSLTII